MDANEDRTPAQEEPNTAATDWRTGLTPDSRKRIVNKIMDTLKRHLPVSGPEGLVDVGKIAARFEEKIYSNATSQSDYLRKISLKMLTMETKSSPGVNNSSSVNSGGNQNPIDPVQARHADAVDVQKVYQMEQPLMQQKLQQQLLQLQQQQYDQHQQKLQLLQQQQLHQQQKQQPPLQLQTQQISQLHHQVNVNDLKVRPGAGVNHGMSLSTIMGFPVTQPNMMNSLKTSSNLESALGDTLQSLPQGVVGSLQQNTINAPQKANVSTLSHSSMNQLQPCVTSLPPNSSMLQQQHLKQQQLIQYQQLKQPYQQIHEVQQLIHQQQQQRMLLLQMQQQFQQQQLHQQHKQQQPSQLQAQHIAQLHQMNEVNDLKVRPGAGIESELFPQPHHAGQHQTTYQQQLKACSPFSVSYPRPLHAESPQLESPQLSQHSSPQINQQNLLTALPKVGTPLQCANSPLIGTSPSTPAAVSPIPGDPEKQPFAISSIPNTGNIGRQQIAPGPTQAQYKLSIGPPSFADFCNLDGKQGNAPTNISGKSSTTERHVERLFKTVVLSLSLFLIVLIIYSST